MIAISSISRIRGIDVASHVYMRITIRSQYCHGKEPQHTLKTMVK